MEGEEGEFWWRVNVNEGWLYNAAGCPADCLPLNSMLS